MKKEELFNEEVQKIVTEETMAAIEEAVESRVQKALDEQDEVYAEKLQTLVDTIDKDHSAKMQRIMEAIDKDHSAKFLKFAKLSKRNQEVDLKGFKKQLVESVGSFLDEFISEAVPLEDIKQAVKNRSAFNVLENLQKVLAVDSVMMKESVTTAILEGKGEIDTLRAENDKLKSSVKVLTEKTEQTKKELFIQDKTSKFPEAKRRFIHKALSDKPLKFVMENYDYTLRLFDKQERKQLNVLKEEAISEREHKPDFVATKVVTEKVNNDNHSMYLEELAKR